MDGGIARTFFFGASGEVLAFVVRVRQISEDAQIKAEIREGFGNARIFVGPRRAAESVVTSFVRRVERAASAIRERQPEEGE